MFGLLALYAFAVGACVGSFLNVVIYRYPRGESIVHPRSRCPHCGAAIAWFDNIPILSFLILRARCRRCRNPISVRYPLVEASNALLYLAIFVRTGPAVGSLLLAALVSMTIALIFIDADVQLLPDAIDLPGVAIGLALSILPSKPASLVLAPNLAQSVLGALVGAGLLLAIAYLYRWTRGIDGMGLGDVKMLAMIGAVLGVGAIFAVLLLASVAGALIGVVIMLAGRSKNLQFALPFGVFLGLAFLTVLFFGNELYALLPALRFLS